MYFTNRRNIQYIKHSDVFSSNNSSVNKINKQPNI